MRGGDRQRNGDEHQEHKGRRGGDAGDRHTPWLAHEPVRANGEEDEERAKMTR